MAACRAAGNPFSRMRTNEIKPDIKRSDDAYRKKYVSLKNRCESIQMENEKCLNRLYYVKKAVRKMSRERRFLTTKLDKYGDNYKNATLTLPVEDDSMLQLLGINSPIAPSFPASRGLAGLVSKSQRNKSSRGRAGRVSRVGGPRLISEMTSHDNQPSGRGGKRKRMPSQNKQEKEKDPLAPKKPANAFLMFCQTERQTMQEESSSKNHDGGDMSHQELTRQLAKRWNYLEAGEKETYYTMYERDKDRYHKQMKEYIQSNNLEPTPATNPTPQPPIDTVIRTDSVLNGKTIPKKEPLIIKSEPISTFDQNLSTSAQKLATTSSQKMVTSSAQKMVTTGAQKMVTTGAQKMVTTSAQKMVTSSAQKILTTSAQKMVTTSAQKMSTTSTQKMMTTSAQKMMTSSAQKMVTTSAQKMVTTSAQKMMTTSAQKMVTTSAQKMVTSSTQKMMTTSGQKMLTTSAQKMVTTSAQKMSTNSSQKTLTNTVMNTLTNTVKKPEITVQVKKELKLDSFTLKPKPSLQLKSVLEGDDPYHFDDD